MTVALLNDRRARRDTRASTGSAEADLTRRERREWGAVDYRTVPLRPVEDEGGVELRMAGPDPLVLPPGVTARGPGRWIVPSKTDLATSPRLRAVLSAAWRVVAGCGP